MNRYALLFAVVGHPPRLSSVEGDIAGVTDVAKFLAVKYAPGLRDENPADGHASLSFGTLRLSRGVTRMSAGFTGSFGGVEEAFH